MPTPLQGHTAASQFDSIDLASIWEALQNQDVDQSWFNVLVQTIYNAMYNTNSNKTLLATTKVKGGNLVNPAVFSDVEAAIQADIDTIIAANGKVRNVNSGFVYNNVDLIYTWIIEYVD